MTTETKQHNASLPRKKVWKLLISKFFGAPMPSMPKSIKDHSISGMFYRMQQAYWYYIDHYRSSHPQDNSPIKDQSSDIKSTNGSTRSKSARKKYARDEFAFMFQMIQESRVKPFYGMSAEDLRVLYDQFNLDMQEIPVSGMILITLDKHCVMVRSTAAQKWGVPKGKQQSNESIWKCAQREVEEETGLKILLCQDSHSKIGRVEQCHIYIRGSLVQSLRWDLKRYCGTSLKNAQTEKAFTIVTPITIFLVHLPLLSTELLEILKVRQPTGSIKEISQVDVVPLDLLMADRKDSKKKSAFKLAYRDRRIFQQFQHFIQSKSKFKS